MSSENIARKFSVKNYIRKYEPDAQPGLPPLSFPDPSLPATFFAAPGL
jgi:hypothetical protein